jgi:superfamily II DNA/RNA helicase
VDVCEEYQKEQKLARLLEEIGCEPHNKILIFVETKRKADDLTRWLSYQNKVLHIVICCKIY